MRCTGIINLDFTEVRYFSFAKNNILSLENNERERYNIMKRKMVKGIAFMAAMVMMSSNIYAADISLEQQSIGLESVENARQLGGYTGADGKTVKDNLLIRTGKLSGATEEDKTKLKDELQVKKIIDFRTTSEKEEAPDPEIEGIQNIWVSILDEEDSTANLAAAATSEEQDPMNALMEYAKSGKVKTMYTDIVVNEHAQEGYAKFFDELLAQEDGAVLWHCTGGKDRAGLATVFLLSALGVDQKTILEDFDLSSEAYKENMEAMGKMAEESGCTEEEVEDVKALAGVKEEYMKDALELIDREYGSMDEYLKNQLQVSEEEKAALQEKYLE